MNPSSALKRVSLLLALGSQAGCFVDGVPSSSPPAQPARPDGQKSASTSRRVRIGKIARLPFSLREQINRRLLDNEEGLKIIAWANARARLKGAARISPGNLSVWRAGGYQDWLKTKSGDAR